MIWMQIALAVLLAAPVWAQRGAAQPALEGLDPVLLTEGKEEAGKDTWTVRHGRFVYQFSSAATKERFEKEPDRYGIQLEGACARMGAPVRGNADVYVVHKQKIYILGSQECYKLFAANPEKYLQRPAAMAWNPSAKAVADGSALLAKVAAANGARIRGYVQVRTLGEGSGTAKETVTVRFPDRFRLERSFRGAAFGTLLAGDGVYSFSPQGMQAQSGAFAETLAREWWLDPLNLLLNSERAEVYLGDGNMLVVRRAGLVFQVLIDATDLTVREVRYTGRGAEGATGEFRVRYSDWRDVEGNGGKARLPFRSSALFAGEAVPARSWTVEQYQLNPAGVDAALEPAR